MGRRKGRTKASLCVTLPITLLDRISKVETKCNTSELVESLILGGFAWREMVREMERKAEQERSNSK